MLFCETFSASVHHPFIFYLTELFLSELTNISVVCHTSLSRFAVFRRTVILANVISKNVIVYKQSGGDSAHVHRQIVHCVAESRETVVHQSQLYVFVTSRHFSENLLRKSAKPTNSFLVFQEHHFLEALDRGTAKECKL